MTSEQLKQENKKIIALKVESEKIKKRNAKFDALPKMKKRVALGKEVLSLLSTRKVKAERGVYIKGVFKQKSKVKIKSLLNDPLSSVQWQQIIPDAEQCHVCALGIGALASINLRNGVSLAQVGFVNRDLSFDFMESACYDILEKDGLFEGREAQWMEQFFESTSRYQYGAIVSPKKALQILWGRIVKDKGELSIEKILLDMQKEIKRSKKVKRGSKR